MNPQQPLLRCNFLGHRSAILWPFGQCKAAKDPMIKQTKATMMKASKDLSNSPIKLPRDSSGTPKDQVFEWKSTYCIMNSAQRSKTFKESHSDVFILNVLSMVLGCLLLSKPSGTLVVQESLSVKDWRPKLSSVRPLRLVPYIRYAICNTAGTS